ncbi:hypothetical protein P170DRAFT_425712 [Aspergillus steynii IBT 23096]|uniref:YCII-related domain-containing protein n=1 Tax=Aspergillus steynii IBT 23096 TaxID=1392250 RepID=A0A2I2G717_9EURO|nr:uncharacterized protein P170DRAFT_425712 [Aspergillus steynii IBT 23096]PLB48679.1 hypothetical protein P170DRAFT_425712 [Aspergillus steynii IBT 23096]
MFIAKTRQTSRFTKALSSRPLLSSRFLHRNDGPRKEYFTRPFFADITHPILVYVSFVLVWDHPGASRAGLSSTDFIAPRFTFAGECLSPVDPDKPQTVQGNAFACLAQNVDEVREIIKESAYYKEGVWDITTAEISPLMTVHSKEYQNGKA